MVGLAILHSLTRHSRLILGLNSLVNLVILALLVVYLFFILVVSFPSTCVQSFSSWRRSRRTLDVLRGCECQDSYAKGQALVRPSDSVNILFFYSAAFFLFFTISLDSNSILVYPLIYSRDIF